MSNRMDKKMPIPYTRIRELNVFTISNFLSLLRVLLLPVIYVAMFQHTTRGDHWALGLMVVAGLTDIFDGWMARLRGTISSFGKIIDPLADKIFMTGIALFLILLRGFPVWLFVLVAARDVWIVVGGAILIRRYKIVFQSNVWGKLYSLSLALLIVAYTLSLDRDITIPLQIVVVGFIIISLLSYTTKVMLYIRTHHRHQRRAKLRDGLEPDNASAAAVSHGADGSTAGR